MLNNKPFDQTYRFRELMESFSFLIPLLIFLVLFIIIPIIGSIITSFYQDVSFLSNKFIFVKNYIQLFQDPGFIQSLFFTLLFIAITVPLELFLGLMFAILLNLNIPFRGILRASVLIPWAIPAAISARTWELFYNFNYGLANFLLESTGISESVNWLGTTIGAFSCVVIADVWKTAPFVAIILLTGLQSIPEDLYKQAKVDRANFFQIFYKITIPLLKPVIIVALLFRTVDALRVFDLIYVLTGGGPGGSTTSLSLYAYKYFVNGDFGYGSAISVILFIIAFSLSVIYIKVSNFRSNTI